MKTIGYARVSTREQSLAMQRQALVDAGCDVIHTDEASGALAIRKGLQAALKGVHASDTLVVWKLDRLGRSMGHVVATVLDLDARGVRFRSLTEAIDLGTPTGKLLLSVFGWLAEVERDLTVERTRLALAAARRRGVKLGRRPKLTSVDVDHARRVIASGEETVAGMARILKVGRNTLGRAIKTRAE